MCEDESFPPMPLGCLIRTGTKSRERSRLRFNNPAVAPKKPWREHTAAEGTRRQSRSPDPETFGRSETLKFGLPCREEILSEQTAEGDDGVCPFVGCNTRWIPHILR